MNQLKKESEFPMENEKLNPILVHGRLKIFRELKVKEQVSNISSIDGSAIYEQASVLKVTSGDWFRPEIERVHLGTLIVDRSTKANFFDSIFYFTEN